MARSSYQKLKPLYIMNYLLQNSDEEHPVTIKQIVGVSRRPGHQCRAQEYLR